MATIKLVRVKCKNLTTKEDLWRLGLKNIGVISAEDVLKHATEHSDVKLGTLRQSLAAITDSLTLFLSIGHGVQLGDLGSLQLSVTSKATKQEKDLTAKNLTGVSVNLRPIGQLAKNIKDFKFSVVGATAEDSESTDDPDDSDNSQNQGGQGTQGGQGNQNQQTQEPVTYRIEFEFEDGSQDAHDYEVGETINYPEPTSGYHWPEDRPRTMPARNVTVTEVRDSSSNYDDDAGF